MRHTRAHTHRMFPACDRYDVYQFDPGIKDMFLVAKDEEGLEALNVLKTCMGVGNHKVFIAAYSRNSWMIFFCCSPINVNVQESVPVFVCSVFTCPCKR